jgi:hypothetical protein
MSSAAGRDITLFSVSTSQAQRVLASRMICRTAARQDWTAAERATVIEAICGDPDEIRTVEADIAAGKRVALSAALDRSYTRNLQATG